MLSTLPISHDRTPILWERPNVSKKPTPNQMVERESFFRKVRQLRGETELLQKPLYEVRRSSAGENEISAQENAMSDNRYCLYGDTNQLQNPKLYKPDYQPSPRTPGSQRDIREKKKVKECL